MRIRSVNSPKAKVSARGIVAIRKFMDKFPITGMLTICTPFRTNDGAHVYIEVRPHQVREMLECWSPKDLFMSDRIILYRLEPQTYHLTFEGLEDIAV
jgi:hypothetical protein